MRIAAVDPASLDKEQKADLEIMKDSVGLALLDLNTIQSFKHNPTVYVELAGNALFNPYMLNYAPKEKRFQQIVKRLQKMPALFEQAKNANWWMLPKSGIRSPKVKTTATSN